MTKTVAIHVWRWPVSLSDSQERKKNFLAVDESTLGGTEVASTAGEPVLVSGVCTPQICEIMTPIK